MSWGLPSNRTERLLYKGVIASLWKCPSIWGDLFILYTSQTSASMCLSPWLYFRPAIVQWNLGSISMSQEHFPQSQLEEGLFLEMIHSHVWSLFWHAFLLASTQRLFFSIWIFCQPSCHSTQMFLAYICGLYHFCLCSSSVISADILNHNTIFPPKIYVSFSILLAVYFASRIF